MLAQGLSLSSTSLILIGCLLIFRVIFPARRSDKPPGPSPLPLLGNIFSMPLAREWKTLHKWAKKYGDIVYVEVLGRRMIILNSLQTTNDLLMAKSSIYSERPRVPLLEVLGHGRFNIPFMPFGEDWRPRRKLFSSQYNNAIMGTYHDSYRAAILNMLRGFNQEPLIYPKHLRLMTTQLMMDITYGITVTSMNDRLAVAVENVLSTVTFCLSPTMLAIDPLPWIRLVKPNNVKRWIQDLQDLMLLPFDQIKAEIAAGVNRRSLVGDQLQRLKDDTGKAGYLTEELIRDAALSSTGGGSDTIICTIVTFLLAMVLHPEIQKQAQAQIDAVVGSKRLPNFSDREHLPMIAAIMHETWRWHPPAPFGVPHCLKTDDTYREYNLEAGTLVIPNIWSILHDPLLFENPMEYNPAKFLDPQEGAKRSSIIMRAVFGFGKRSCPGVLLAEEVVWLTICQFLALFTISLDEEFPPEVEFTSGAISQPVPFKYKLQLRSAESYELLKQQ